jgi:hypothetical protein
VAKWHPDFVFLRDLSAIKGTTMFVCYECGKECDDNHYFATQIGGTARICLSCSRKQPLTNSRADEFRRDNATQFARRELIALQVLCANFANPAMNGPTTLMMVSSAIKASFRVADEFILHSVASWETEQRKSVP